MMYFIGIDTGTETGFAVWSSERCEYLEVTSMKIHQAMTAVLRYCIDHPFEVKVFVEDARQRKWIPRQKKMSSELGRRIGAGYVKRDACIWEDFLTDNGIPFEMVAPKDNETKLKSALFKTITGWKGKTNEHGRDAAMLVFYKMK